MSELRTTERGREAAPRRGRSNPGGSDGNRPLPPAELARRAARDLADLLGREPESIVGLERTDVGWCIELEVLDTPRIPATSDILAEYAVDVDRRGNLVAYRRVRRYPRGRIQDDR
jgi:Gas vesicle synthesis protein GvpO